MNNPRLSIIPARAATDRALKPRDLQVLCVLGRHTDDLGWCRRSQVKMAEEMDCARATVFESIRRLVDTGYVEKHVQESESGRDSAHIYRVILDPVHPNPMTIRDADDPCRYTGTPAGIPAPLPVHEPAPPAGPEPAPMLTTPINDTRESAREENQEGEKEGHDDPAKFELRVKRIAAKTSWPKWEKSPTQWAVQQFAKLTSAERLEAERLAIAYAAHCKSGVVPLGVYFRDRKWTDLPNSVLKAVEVAEAREAGIRAYEPVLGPVWAAKRMSVLIAGPIDPLPKSTLYLEGLMSEDSERGRAERKRHVRDYGYPALKGLDAFGVKNTGEAEEAALHQKAREATEAVPVGAETWLQWKSYFEQRGWLWVPDPGKQPVVYFPVGGPDGLEAFKQAVMGNEHDGNR